MIVVDASALLAVYLEEPDGPALRQTIEGAQGCVMSPVNVWEVLVRAERLKGLAGRQAAEALLSSLGILTVEVDAAQMRLAVEAFARFGHRQTSTSVTALPMRCRNRATRHFCSRATTFPQRISLRLGNPLLTKPLGQLGDQG